MGGLDFKDDAKGVCSTYKVLKTCQAKYDTRMRIYQSKQEKDVVVVSFRPTQQTPEVGAGHLLTHPSQIRPCVAHSFIHPPSSSIHSSNAKPPTHPPTFPTIQGGAIHDNRQMVPC